MPSAPPVTAVLNALTISLTLLFSEPVHWYEQPSSLHASSAPYFVGTKNGLVVTWLTNTNFRLPFDPKMPAAGVPLDWLVWALVVAGLLLPPHAEMMAVARPAPAPVSAVRRVIARQRDAGVSSSLPSAHSRRSIASLANSDSWSGTVASLSRTGRPLSAAVALDPPESLSLLGRRLFTLTFGVSSRNRIGSRPAARGVRTADRLWNAGDRTPTAALGVTAQRGRECRRSRSEMPLK